MVVRFTTYPGCTTCGARVYMQNSNTHQDVQGTLRAIFELFDGGKNREDETGKDQEEAKRKEENKNVYKHWIAVGFFKLYYLLLVLKLF